MRPAILNNIYHHSTCAVSVHETSVRCTGSPKAAAQPNGRLTLAATTRTTTTTVAKSTAAAATAAATTKLRHRHANGERHRVVQIAIQCTSSAPHRARQRAVRTQKNWLRKQKTTQQQCRAFMYCHAIASTSATAARGARSTAADGGGNVAA